MEPVPAATEAKSTLDQWREIQRRLEGLPDGHPDAVALQRQAGHLRREYQSSVRRAVETFRASRSSERA